MGGSKPKQPKTPNIQGPVNVTTPFGAAYYNNRTGTYNMTSTNDPEAATNLGLAETGFQGALSQLQNPSAAINQARQTYANYMVPAFQRQQAQSFGAAEAGLGNQYNSTFGQLTLHDKANQDAIAAANLQQQIYNAGNQRYSQMLADAGQAGNLADQAQQIRMTPYGTLTSALGTGGQTTNAYNNTLANLYGTQANMYNQLVQQQTAQQQAAASIAGSAIGAGGNMGAAYLSPATLAGA